MKILDATIYTHEILHSMDYNKKESMVLKLDISNAYGRVGIFYLLFWKKMASKVNFSI